MSETKVSRYNVFNLVIDVTVQSFFFQRHHGWWSIRWRTQRDFALLCGCLGPPNPEGEKVDWNLGMPVDWTWIICYQIFPAQVEVASLITQKLLKVSMKHIEIIAKARQKGIAQVHHPLSLFFVFTIKENNKPLPCVVKNAEYLQQAALEEYGPDLHVALRSRRDEFLYLRKLTEMLFPYILPPKATDCR